MLAGRRVVVTRAEGDGATLGELLAARGAIPVNVPLIATVDDEAELARLATLDVDVYDWVVVSSPRGAERLTAAHPAIAAKVGAVGRTTAAAVPRCDFVPTVQNAAGFVAEFPRGGGRVLVVQAATAAPTMAAGLAAAGYEVTVVAPYRTVPATPSDELREALAGADAVLFASGSAAEAWVEVIGRAAPPVVVAIGPQTAAAARRAGLAVTVVAEDHSLRGMVDALALVLGP
jgi:uroporphyrinogen-III synthase